MYILFNFSYTSMANTSAAVESEVLTLALNNTYNTLYNLTQLHEVQEIISCIFLSIAMLLSSLGVYWFRRVFISPLHNNSDTGPPLSCTSSFDRGTHTNHTTSNAGATQSLPEYHELWSSPLVNNAEHRENRRETGI